MLDPQPVGEKMIAGLIIYIKSVGLNVSFLFQVTHTVGTEFAKANMFIF